MPSFATSRRVNHTAEQMYDLVADVEAYPQFLPLCRSLHVTRRSEEGGTKTLVADMEVGYKAIRETFTSKVVCERLLLKILVNYIDGPFKYLENTWSFRDIAGHGCHVDFNITYEFKSRMLSMVMGGMFDAAFRHFAEAFEKRADKVMGEGSRRVVNLRTVVGRSEASSAEDDLGENGRLFLRPLAGEGVAAKP